MRKVLTFLSGVALISAVESAPTFAAPAQSLTTDGSGSNANIITVSGTIPEYVAITKVDNVINLKSMGTLARTATAEQVAKFTGDVDSSLIPANNQFLENGSAEVSFDSNTYISVSTTVNRITNAGPDGVPGTADDYILPTQYARAIKGQSVYIAGKTGSPFHFPGDFANTGYNTGFFAVTSDGLTMPLITFGPGADSGFRIRTKFTRNGLNDYKGLYTAKLYNSYTKY